MSTTKQYFGGIEQTYNRGRCPACNHVCGNKEDAKHVFTCKACGALFVNDGLLYLGESYSYVIPAWDADGACAPEDQRYFDFTVLSSKGIERRHGWFNPATKRITQVG